MNRKPKFKSSVVSRIFGKFASHEFLPSIQSIINKTYVKLMKVDLSEFEEATSYKSLNALFTRKLRSLREFNTDQDIFISPSDAFISESGSIEEQRALQIKGHAYRVREFLGDYISEENKDKLIDGDFLNFYLSPKDYHRYHVPIDMRIEKAVHIPGKLYPVNLTWLKRVEELFIENERVVLECYTKEEKLFYMVFVGALNVGKMSFTFDASIQTNACSSVCKPYNYKNLWLDKGAELGTFEMGSTIIMLFEKDMVTLTCENSMMIKYTKNIAKKI
jgi:phosphatidylserine decarboxylase